ncbi:MAG: SDR family oxidoreductase [Hyphomicrobium sp.]|nr:SDR family oxidoreductase [Hyphomicrobium sp.]
MTLSTATKTILITGASRGIGLAAAEMFAARGWQVAATMRSPNTAILTADGNRIRTYRLDVTDTESVNLAIEAVLADCGRIDAVVNNAGYCLPGAFEAQSEEDFRRHIETNLMGAMRVTRAVLPAMRAQGGGRIINMSSICGRMTLPLYTGYCASKWAIEGFTEALGFELRRHNIKVKLIEPGVFRTGSFDQQMQDLAERRGHAAYDDFVADVLPRMADAERAAPGPAAVAEAIWRAATDCWPRLRYSPRGTATLAARQIVPDVLFVRGVRRLLNAW